MPPRRSQSGLPRRGLARALKHLPQLDRGNLSRIAQQLAEERTLLDALVQSLQEAVIVTDRLGAIQVINNAAERLLGLPDDQVRPEGRANLWRAVPPLAHLLKVGRSGALTLAGPISHQLQINYPTSRLVRLYAAPLGERILIVLSDQTAQLEDSQRQVEDARLNSLTQLAAGVAHELGNPLNALQIHLQVIERQLRQLRATPKLTQSLATAQAEVTRLDHIIRHFLQAIRPAPPHLVPTDPIEVLEESLSFLQAELAGAGIRVQISLPGLLPQIMADAGQLRQVYFNLIKNAREATPSGGTLHISASTDDEYLRLSFTDSGAGIAPEDLAHLFEPYHTTKPGGTGLGLVIAQKIMRAHGGSISIASQPAQGTTVTLSFPLQYRRFRPLAAPSSPPPGLPTPPASPS